MKIRFEPLDRTRDNPNDRRRCYYIIEGLRNVGVDATLYEGSEDFDILVTANRDFRGWLPKIQKLKAAGKLIIFDSSDDLIHGSESVVHMSDKNSPTLSSNLVQRIKSLIHTACAMGSKAITGTLKRWQEHPPNSYMEAFLSTCDGIVTGSGQQAKSMAQFSSKVFEIVDTVHLKEYNLLKTNYDIERPVVIVWEGTRNNVPYLEVCQDAILRLSREYDVVVKVITDKYRVRSYKGMIDNRILLSTYPFQSKFVEWRKDSFVKELIEGDIAIAPLIRDPFAYAKPANKILGYMAIGLPFVCSDTETYKTIQSEYSVGFTASNTDEWYSILRTLINDPLLRSQQGTCGRQVVLENFTLEKTVEKWLAVFHNLLEKKGSELR